MRHLFIAALLSSVLDLARGKEDDDPPIFRTEPDFEPPIFKITSTNHGAFSREYIFITPTIGGKGQVAHIYDQRGTLVWYGAQVSQAGFGAQDLHVCNYLGEAASHLCLHEIDYRKGHGSKDNRAGRKVFFDSSYSQIGLNYTYPDGEGGGWPNQHDFNVVDNGESFLQPVYRRIPMDLSIYNGQEDGDLLDACFSEISVRSGQSQFEWCFMEHFPNWIEESHARGARNTNYSFALGAKTWDAFHLNAIDKTAEGDYLLCLRHQNEIMKVAGRGNRHGVAPGSILWRLGGDFNMFDMGKVSFSNQHHVRSISVSASEEVFSIFNNGQTQRNETTGLQDTSAGMIIRVNNSTMVADVVQEFPHPHGKNSGSQGSLQLLDNGNVFIGWGSVPELSEFLADGTVAWHAAFSLPGNNTNTWSYRGFKFPWIGRPSWKPKMAAYACKHDDGSSSFVSAYVSWNGATEVASWRFLTGDSQDGDFTLACVFEKAGFETRALLRDGLGAPGSLLPRQLSVEALDKNGEILGSAFDEIIVPTAEDFDDICTAGPDEDALQAMNESSAGRAWKVLQCILVIGICEATDWILQRICIRF